MHTFDNVEYIFILEVVSKPSLHFADITIYRTIGTVCRTPNQSIVLSTAAGQPRCGGLHIIGAVEPRSLPCSDVSLMP